MDLKKQNEKIQISLKKVDDTEKVASIEQRLDQTLVKYDSLQEEHEFLRKQFEQVQQEYNETIVSNRLLQGQKDRLLKSVDQMNVNLR